jgi:hypothetical protein
VTAVAEKCVCGGLWSPGRGRREEGQVMYLLFAALLYCRPAAALLTCPPAYSDFPHVAAAAAATGVPPPPPLDCGPGATEGGGREGGSISSPAQQEKRPLPAGLSF